MYCLFSPFYLCNLHTLGLKSAIIFCFPCVFFVSCSLVLVPFCPLYSCWSKIVCLCALLSMSACLTRLVFQELIQVGTILCIRRITDLQHIKTRTFKKCAYRFWAWCWISFTVSSASRCQVIWPSSGVWSGILVFSLCALSSSICLDHYCHTVLV